MANSVTPPEFFIPPDKLEKLRSTHQGRVSQNGFFYQAAYAEARLASLCVGHPCFGLQDTPARLRYDWGEDLDEVLTDGKVIHTQCKRVSDIGQPAKLAEVLLGFAPKLLWTPSEKQDDVRFRLVCSDTRFSNDKSLTDAQRKGVKQHFLDALNKAPSEESDLAKWQEEARNYRFEELFNKICDVTDILYLPEKVIENKPAGSMLPAESEGVTLLMTHNVISNESDRQKKALEKLRSIIYENVIVFDPESKKEFTFNHRAPKEFKKHDVSIALLPFKGRLTPLPFEIVEKCFLNEQLNHTPTPYVNRPPEWKDVVHGEHSELKFIERDKTEELERRVIDELIAPLQRGENSLLRMLFVVGEPDAGKSTLVRRVAAKLVMEGNVVVANAALQPTVSPSEYLCAIQELEDAGLPVLLLLDEPLSDNSPWVEVLKSLNRPNAKTAVLASSTRSSFDKHSNLLQQKGITKFNLLRRATENERERLFNLWCIPESTLIDGDPTFKELAVTASNAQLSNTTDSKSTLAIASPITNWKLIETAWLADLLYLSPEKIIRYFDGATPTWEHAICDDIPRRTEVETITTRLREAQNKNHACSLQLILAAGGEGKSTLLLQAAALAAKSGAWNVLWREDPCHPLPPQDVAKLDPNQNWLIVADDAENLVNNLAKAARLLHSDGRSHVHFLVAARDTDWSHSNGKKQSWDTHLSKSDILLRKLTDDDAERLVNAWKKYGEKGLGKLSDLPDKAQQVNKLLEAVNEPSRVQGEGSFFGGLLAVRFGATALQAHVTNMLYRLEGRKIQGSEHTLFKALVYVAACHAVGIQGLDERVLADLLNVSSDKIYTQVVLPLGEEAAAVRSAKHVLTRHSKVAAAILIEAKNYADIAEIWSAIVRQTVFSGMKGEVSTQTHPKIVHIGPNLQHKLEELFDEQLCKEIAVAAAKAAMESDPTRLSYIVDLGKTYRKAGDYTAAVQMFHQHNKELKKKTDYGSDVRGYWYEWGLNEGKDTVSDRAADAWLQGLSLGDHLRTEITLEQAKLSFSGLGFAFGKLTEPRSDCPFALARRASAFLGRRITDDPTAISYYDKYDHESDKIGTPYPQNIGEAINWLTVAVNQARHEQQNPSLKNLLKSKKISFNMLHKLFEPQVAPVVNAKSLQALNTDEDHIRKGIERVLAKAWESVPSDMADEERFKTARLNVSKAIDGLKPHIKREVRTHFETEKWESLKARDPKHIDAVK